MFYQGSPTVQVAAIRALIEEQGLTISEVVCRVAMAEGQELLDRRGRGVTNHPLFRRLMPSQGRLTLVNADRVIVHGLRNPMLWHTVPELAAIYETL